MSSSVSRRRDDTADAFDGSGSLRTVPAPKMAAATVRALPAIHKFNGIVATAIVVLLLLAPIPLGSNRPAFWMIWSTSVGLATFLYGGALMVLRAPPRVGLSSLWPEFTLLLLLCAWVGFQILPVGGWMPVPGAPVEGLATTPRSISLDSGNAQLVLIQFFTFGLLYLLTVQVAINRRRARRMLLAIFLIVVAFAGYGLISLTQLGDTLLGFEKQIYQGYATATFINRNSFATFLAVGLTTGVAYGMQLLADRKALTATRLIGMLALILLGMAFIAAALLATGSRLGTASALVGVVVVLVLGALVYRGSSRAFLIAAALLFLCAIAAMLLFGTTLLERTVLLSGVDTGRAEIHHQVWAAIRARPWTGYGAGSFATVFQTLQQPPLSTEFAWENSHSTYLALWFELGLFGGSIPLLLIGIAGTRALLALRDPSSTALSLASAAAIAVFATHSLLDFPAEIEANAFLLVVLLGLGAAGAVNGHQARRHANTASVLP